jgi:hypothetical protein
VPWEKTTVCEGENGGEVKQPATAKRGRQVRQVTFGVQVWEKHEGQSFLPSLKLSMTLHTNTKSWVNGFTSPGNRAVLCLTRPPLQQRLPSLTKLLKATEWTGRV